MDASTTAEAAGLLATMLATCGGWPQLRKLVRTGDAAGISVSCAMLGIGTEAAWAAYAVRSELWMALPEAVLMLTANACMAVLLVRSGVRGRNAVRAATAWAIVIATVFSAGGPTAVAALLGLGYAVQAAPSVWTAYRTRVPSGIAPLAWVLVGAEGLLWGLYAVHHGDPAILAFAVISVTTSSAIVLRVHTTRHRGAVMPVRRGSTGSTTRPGIAAAQAGV